LKRIEEFDGLRTLAVLVVIFDHYAPFRNFANGAAAKYGGVGVDIFFVLSGFLITTILLGMKGTERAYRIFYARRFLRILPPFVLLLLLVYGLGVIWHEPFEKAKALGELLFLRSFKGTGALLIHVWNTCRGLTPVPGLFAKIGTGLIPRDYPWLPISASLGPTWSLSVEEWFYVLWAPVVLLLRRPVILVVGSLACAVGFFARWFGSGGADFLSSVDILIAGAMLALWMEKRDTLAIALRNRFDHVISLLSTLAFILLVSLALAHRDRISRTLIEIVVFGLLAWFIRHAGSRHPISAFLRLRTMVYLGTVSYALYLIHLPMYFVVRAGLHRYITGASEIVQMWLVAIISLAASVCFSALSWKYYEQPILGLKEALTDRLKGMAEPQLACKSSFVAAPVAVSPDGAE
jgi:peptidoglycan/LPS O-acetylase OafA/YrhL